MGVPSAWAPLMGLRIVAVSIDVGLLLEKDER
jgi:hypothetical protein